MEVAQKSKLIFVRAKTRGWYANPEEIHGDPKYNLTYAPGGRMTGKLYDPEGGEARKDPSSLNFWCREQDFSDYSVERFVEFARTDKKGNVVFGKDGKPIMLKKSAGRGWMERLPDPALTQAAPVQVTINAAEMQPRVAGAAIQHEAQATATVVVEAPRKRGRPARPAPAI